MKTLPLSKGYEALVDDDDFERLSRFKWTAQVNSASCGAIYGYRIEKTADGEKRKLYLHREVMFCTRTDREVDHGDHNGLNCQKNNLEVVTKPENLRRRRKRREKCEIASSVVDDLTVST